MGAYEVHYKASCTSIEDKRGLVKSVKVGLSVARVASLELELPEGGKLPTHRRIDICFVRFEAVNELSVSRTSASLHEKVEYSICLVLLIVIVISGLCRLIYQSSECAFG